MIFNSIYISVENMERAIDFYKKFFKKEPASVNKRFTSFNLSGFSFSLYSLAVDNEELKLGNNCGPHFQSKQSCRGVSENKTIYSYHR